MIGRSFTAQCVGFGDFSLGMAWACRGKLKGEEAQAQATRKTSGRMREAFDAVVARSEEGRTEKAEVEARVADLQEELKRIAAIKASQARGDHPAVRNPTEIRWERRHLEGADCHLADEAALT